MTARFSVLAQSTLRLSVLAAVLGVAGCMSQPPAANGSAVNTGTYPNLNIIPQPAAEQISPAEKAEKMARLNGHKGRQGGADAQSPAERERLRRIAASHADETLKAIEGQ